MHIKIGSQYELSSGRCVEVSKILVGGMVQVFSLDDPKRKKHAIYDNLLTRLISSPLPDIGDPVIDEDGLEGEVISNLASLTIKKKNMITSHNLDHHAPKVKISQKNLPLDSGDRHVPVIQNSRRGGKRTGAGRPPSGNPPKQRKPLQLDLAIAQSLPDLKMLHALIQEFRPVAESGTLRSQRLADFYKKFDSLPKISN